MPRLRDLVAAPVAAAALVCSQLFLIGFVWLNRKTAAFRLLGAGLLLNLTVILANGGLMPISPQTIQRLAPDTPLATWKIGSRFGTTKDIILAPEQIRLGWLADGFTTPTWFPHRVAFSPGDVLIACGAFWLFWHGANCQKGHPVDNPVVGRRNENDSQGEIT
jgi:hypothetical protein